jgi:tetratricopeptide (TPR) repeat protein
MNSSRLESLLHFLEQDPNDSFTRYAVALEYVSAGEIETGISYLNDLLERDSGYVAAYQRLGYLYGEIERKDEAADILKRGIEIALKAGDTHAASEMQAALDDTEL